MKTLEKLEHLIANCCTVSIGTNDHRSVYATVQEHFADFDFLRNANNFSPEIVQTCIDHDSIVTIQVYPRTPIGFNHYIGHSLASAVDAAYTDMFLDPLGWPLIDPKETVK